MVVGTARIVLALPGNDSLKGKRKVVRRIVDRVRHRYNAAVAEVADMDVHRRIVLGLSVVSNDARHANSMLDAISGFVSGASEAVVLDRRMELVHLGEGEHLLEDDWFESTDVPNAPMAEDREQGWRDVDDDREAGGRRRGR